MLRFLSLLACVLSVLAAADERAPNSPAHRNKPYVLMIGLDGFRFDYAERYGAANLLAIGRRGVKAERLIPSFPSKTFPNFYTLATGLHPGEHGVTGNRFYDPERNAEFNFRAPSARDGSWYGGTPLWVLAERQGMRTASYFWVGTDVEIQGVRPSEYVPYNANDTHHDRIRRVSEWFRLPVEQRPHLVTVYFADVDAVGHLHGPESPEVIEAVRRVDQSVGELMRAVPPDVNVILVSDHGMDSVGNIVDLGTEADYPGVKVVGVQSEVLFYSNDAQALEHARRKLLSIEGNFRVFRRSELPKHLKLRNNRRSGDLLAIANGTDWVVVRAPGQERRPPPKGYHGWDPRAVPNMGGIFIAAGPHIKQLAALGAVPAVSIYALVVDLLGLTSPPGQKLHRELSRIRVTRR